MQKSMKVERGVEPPSFGAGGVTYDSPTGVCNDDDDDDVMMERLKQETRQACLAEVERHLDGFLRRHPGGTYEQWIGELHPENLCTNASSGEKSVDHRFYIEGNDHLRLWEGSDRLRWVKVPKEAVPSAKRAGEARRLFEKYPDRVPVICEKAARSDLPDLQKKKFLVPGTMRCGEFKHVVRKHLCQTIGGPLPADQTLYLLVANTTPKVGVTMSEIYDRHKDEDGFLYTRYSAENTLGSG